jgi:hypothetical protein
MIEKFLNDEQDPKAVEKIYQRLRDLLTTGEEIIYIAVQKKPIVNLFPDCIALTNKRILFFTPSNFGLSIKFMDFVWKDVVDVFTKEEIIGAVFGVKTTSNAEILVDYLPKVQARKLYQYAQERKEQEREARRQRGLEDKRAASGSIQLENERMAIQQPVNPVAAPVQQPEPIQAPVALPPYQPPSLKPDELAEKLKKLKMLFENGLITQEEYNQKKQELLSQL